MQKKLLDDLNDKNSLREVQQYIKKVIEIRGFSDESIQEKMLLLTEEIGELAKAIRRHKVGMAVDVNKPQNSSSIEGEIADVFIVLNAVCNVLNVDLFNCFKNKEDENIRRIWK